MQDETDEASAMLQAWTDDREERRFVLREAAARLHIALDRVRSLSAKQRQDVHRAVAERLKRELFDS